MPSEIGGTAEGTLGQPAKFAADQTAVGRLADTDGAVHALGDEIDQAVAFADMELNGGMAFQKVRQARQQIPLGEAAVDVYPQRPRGHRLGGGGICIIDRHQDGQTTPVVVLALRRQCHLAGRACQQADAEMPFELLDRLRYARTRQAEIRGRLRETAPLDHAGEGLHRSDPVH